MNSKNFDLSAKLNRANEYSRCATKHCKPKKTKRFRKCSKKVECPNIESLQVCIDSVKHEPIYNVGLGKYYVPENIIRKGIVKKQNTGTYNSIKPPPGAGSYVEMEYVKNPGPSPSYVSMKPARRAPAILPKPKKTIKKSSPHIFASVRKTRTSNKRPPNFYAFTQREGKKQGSPLKPTGANKPIPNKPTLGKVAELRKKFELKTKK